MKTLIIFLALSFGITAFAETPQNPAAPSSPSHPAVATEAGVSSQDFTDCPACARLPNQNQVNAQGQQLIINWDRLQTHYDFNDRPNDDQRAILGNLHRDDLETADERAARLLPGFNVGGGRGGAIGRLQGLGTTRGGTKIKLKLGHEKGIKVTIPFR